jgi:ABC-2 type transport system ATP-binding protein
MIKVEQLRKEFRTKVAVDGVSFTVEKGEVLGFLGPNGAGKSTTMRMVTGYFLPTSGSISVNGVDMIQQPEIAKRSMGYLPENAPLYSDMTVLSVLGFCAEMRGLQGEKKTKALDRVLDMCFLHNVRHQSVDTLSKGYRHRTCFAQSIIHDPEILILDEPTDGLDPNQKHEVRSMIKRMGKDKVILFSTHILEEVEAACTRAVIINRGKVIADGTPQDLKRRGAGAGSLVLGLGGTGAIAGVEAELRKIGGIKEIQVSVSSAHKGFYGVIIPEATSSPIQMASSIAELASSKKWALQELHRDEGKLDEFFRSITQSDIIK